MIDAGERGAAAAPTARSVPRGGRVPPLPVAPAPQPGLPAGFHLRLADGAWLDAGGRAVLGGDPFRIVRLGAPAAAILRRWLDGQAVGPGATDRALARRLVERNLALPLPPSAAVPPVTVVVPVRDRPAQLRRLLAALAQTDGVVRTVVVDDASVDPGPVAAAADAHGAELVRRPERGRAAAARNSGLAAVDTPLVAFVDSDCVPRPGWLSPLAAHLADPRVALAAPRITALRTGAQPVARYEAHHAPLDRGPRPALVVPGGAVPFVPGAALLARTAALGAGFDERLRGGEDVDLVWRLTASGWHVRYEPAAHVAHDHRLALRPWLARRAYYGRTAAGIARRHPGAARPVRMSPWSAAAWAAVAARRPAVAGAITATAVGLLAVRLRGVVSTPVSTAVRLAGGGTWGAGRAVADAAIRHWWPASALAAATVPALRAPLAAALLTPLLDRPVDGSAVDPGRWLALRLLDDVAYGAGVWHAAVRTGTADPLLPDLGWRLVVEDVAADGTGWPDDGYDTGVSGC
jgi:mycofactocin system glycosyltransferase